jgi:hypothetical protein
MGRVVLFSLDLNECLAIAIDTNIPRSLNKWQALEDRRQNKFDRLLKKLDLQGQFSPNLLNVLTGGDCIDWLFASRCLDRSFMPRSSGRTLILLAPSRFEVVGTAHPTGTTGLKLWAFRTLKNTIGNILSDLFTHSFSPVTPLLNFAFRHD